MADRTKQTPPSTLKTYTVQQVSAVLAVSDRQVVGLFQCGAMTPFNISRRPGRPTWRVEAEELNRFILSRRLAPPPPRARRRKRPAEVIEFYK
jgi:hypothetical protein